MTAPLSRICSLCSRVFFPTDPDARPLYCTRQHAKDANYQRRRWKNHKGGHCPNPIKRTFTTVEDADKACERMSGMNTYRCLCGELHVGHPDRAKKFGVADMVDLDTVDALREKLGVLSETTAHEQHVQAELETVRTVLADLEARLDNRNGWLTRLAAWFTERKTT